jgi:hypothetical protein
MLQNLKKNGIFYSNAAMFHRSLMESKKKLLEKSPSYKEFNKLYNPQLKFLLINKYLKTILSMKKEMNMMFLFFIKLILYCP